MKGILVQWLNLDEVWVNWEQMKANERKSKEMPGNESQTGWMKCGWISGEFWVNFGWNESKWKEMNVNESKTSYSWMNFGWISTVSQSVNQFHHRLVRYDCYSQRDYVISKASFAHGSQPRTGTRLRPLALCLWPCLWLWHWFLGFKLYVINSERSGLNVNTLNHVRLVFSGVCLEWWCAEVVKKYAYIDEF